MSIYKWYFFNIIVHFLSYVWICIYRKQLPSCKTKEFSLDAAPPFVSFLRKLACIQAQTMLRKHTLCSHLLRKFFHVLQPGSCFFIYPPDFKTYDKYSSRTSVRLGAWFWSAKLTYSLLLTHSVHSNGILPMLRISNRQNLLSIRYHTEFSVQKIPNLQLKERQPRIHSRADTLFYNSSINSLSR